MTRQAVVVRCTVARAKMSNNGTGGGNISVRTADRDDNRCSEQPFNSEKTEEDHFLS